MRAYLISIALALLSSIAFSADAPKMPTTMFSADKLEKLGGKANLAEAAGCLSELGKIKSFLYQRPPGAGRRICPPAKSPENTPKGCKYVITAPGFPGLSSNDVGMYYFNFDPQDPDAVNNIDGLKGSISGDRKFAYLPLTNVTREGKVLSKISAGKNTCLRLEKAGGFNLGIHFSGDPKLTEEQRAALAEPVPGFPCQVPVSHPNDFEELAPTSQGPEARSAAQKQSLGILTDNIFQQLLALDHELTVKVRNKLEVVKKFNEASSKLSPGTKTSDKFRMNFIHRTTCDMLRNTEGSEKDKNERHAYLASFRKEFGKPLASGHCRAFMANALDQIDPVRKVRTEMFFDLLEPDEEKQSQVFKKLNCTSSVPIEECVAGSSADSTVKVEAGDATP